MAAVQKRAMPKLDTAMSDLSMLDKTGPMTASLKSPFLASPIMASTLLFAAGQIAKDQPARPERKSTMPFIRNPVRYATIADVVEAGVEVKQSKILLEGSFKPIAVAAFEDLLFLVRIAKWKVAYANGESFDRQEQLPYFGRFDEAAVTKVFDTLIGEIWPTVEGQTEPKEAIRARELAKVIIGQDTPIAEVVGALKKAFELLTKAVARLEGAGYSSFDSSEDAKSDFSLIVKHDPDRLVVEWDKSLGETLLSAVSKVAQKLRDVDQDPTFIDYLVFHVGYELLRSGAQLDSSDARWMGTPGFRTTTQTYVSLTDPGDGHIFGTTRKTKWLKGAICHVEHLERPGNLHRDDIESYRIPSIFEFARVRLHTGNAAPNTYFVGRRVKDSTNQDFGHDFIKVVNLTSAACSAAFQLGAAETKVAMDGLTASEAVAYMRALSGHVLRNSRQILSCAWNLNTPLVDDLAEVDAEGKWPMIEDNVEIGKRGIELAVLGGFDKCTFDGAADSYPSKCVILQLSVPSAIELIHLAHQSGLLTYLSAGFKLGGSIGDAVLSGVDGIGIGGAQILRYMDHKTGHQGPYTEEFIDQIHSEQYAAANSVRGRGVHLLCRLDRMHYEGSSCQAEEDLRIPLYNALRTEKESEIQPFLDHPELKNIIGLSDDGESPTKGYALRLLRPGRTPLLAKTAAEGGAESAKWIKFTKDLGALIKFNDEESLSQYYGSQPWSAFHENYKAVVPHLRPARLFTVKAAPHC